MIKPVKSQTQSPIIVALDVPKLSEALTIVQELKSVISTFKVGLELLTAEGAPQVVRALQNEGVKLFFDGKFSDIPNTVGAAAKSVAELGVEYFDVHATCGEAAVRAAVEARGTSKVLVVTVLTALTRQECQELYGADSESKVIQYAQLALRAGAQGIVCSPMELQLLSKFPELASLEKVTPGVRPNWASSGDQKRVLTPKEAIQKGATRLVIGRPILSPPPSIGTRIQAVKKIMEEIQ